MSNICAGYHCLPAVQNKTEEFSKYDTVKPVGMHTYGGCGFNKADKVVERTLGLKKAGAEVIHMGVCMMYFCPLRKFTKKL
jgi:predicted metal-binding protein